MRGTDSLGAPVGWQRRVPKLGIPRLPAGTIRISV